MQLHMIRLRRQQHEILWSIIQFISIQVVRYFTSIKFATKVLFKHYSMFIYSFAIYSDTPVTNGHNIPSARRSVFGWCKGIAASLPYLIMEFAPAPAMPPPPASLDNADLSYTGFGKWIAMHTPGIPMPFAVTASQMFSFTILNRTRFHYA
jgi:hypothetical protein